MGPLTSAKLTFTDAYNADLSANELFIHLFSFAYIPGNIGTSNWVYEFGAGGISDVYTGGTVPSWVVGNISLTQLSFPAAGQTPGTSPGDPMTEVGKRWRAYDEGSQANGTWIATAGSNLKHAGRSITPTRSPQPSSIT